MQNNVEPPELPAPKKVVILGPAHPLRGGLASYNERLAREFMRLGHSVIIYTFSLQYPGLLFPGTSQYSSEPAPADLDIRVKVNSVNPFNWLKVGRELRKLCPDIIVVKFWLPFMGPCFGTILRSAKKNRHTRAVCIVDNIIPHEHRPGDKAFTKYFTRVIDGFITMSEKVRTGLNQFAPATPGLLIPHPLYDNFGDKIPRSEARAWLGIDQQQPLLLFFGFIRKYKGLDLLLDAIQLLSEEQDPGFTIPRLLVAGEFYEDARAYDTQLNRPGTKERVILRTAFIPDSEVKYYLCAADLVVQPYRSATQSGVTPLAYHFEVPMLVTNVGGLPDLVPDKKVGLVAEPNAASLAQAIKDFYRMGRQHFLPYLVEEKKNYSWEKMANAVISLAASK